MDTNGIYGNPKQAQALATPNFTKPVWSDPQKSCHDCNYNDQDVDTFPCAKCHTRD